MYQERKKNDISGYGSDNLEPYSNGSNDPMPKVKTKAREIVIRELDHGYIVNVGCQSFAIEEKDKMARLLLDYLENPAKTEETHHNGNLF